eukprot:GFUD01024478.1.p1 GENE.GFUD01024478.1~~GFUD01024478.1.p1  ORF type:complete len:224 (+),score=88.81 GFUD01024478.1:43-714(+)
MAGSGQFKAVHNEWDIGCKVWVGGLGEEGTRLELEESFTKFGPVKNIWLAKNPPSFAFIEMEDPRDAEDSVAALNGTEVCGMRAHVEMARDKDERRKRAQEKQLRLEMEKRKIRLETEKKESRGESSRGGYRDREEREYKRDERDYRDDRRGERDHKDRERSHHPDRDRRDDRESSRGDRYRDDDRGSSRRSPRDDRGDSRDKRGGGSSRDSYQSYRRDHDRW